MNKDYLNINKSSWNKRTEAHVVSDFYNNDSFIKGRNSLNSIELELLGDVKGLGILHLQCHFGQDSISLSRMGANVTGVDFSSVAIQKAKELAQQCSTNTQFIESDIYNLPNVLNEQFDMVFTSYGTIGWLPDIEKWASVVSKYLKPGGQFVFAEFHPTMWMFDNDVKHIQYNYFKDQPIVEEEEGTYADKDAKINLNSITWNHSLSSVFTALVNHEITIQQFQEFDYSPYNCFSNMIEPEKGKFRFAHLDNKLPIVYALKGTKIAPSKV